MMEEILGWGVPTKAEGKAWKFTEEVCWRSAGDYSAVTSALKACDQGNGRINDSGERLGGGGEFRACHICSYAG